jgi:hypothetical protein
MAAFMNRERTIRRVRIAVSGTCVVLSLLLIVLWVRSYWIWDRFDARLLQRRSVIAGSINGGMLVQFPLNDWMEGWRWTSRALTGPGITRSPFRFGSEFRVIECGFQIPHWFPALVFGILAAVASPKILCHLL